MAVRGPALWMWIGAAPWLVGCGGTGAAGSGAPPPVEERATCAQDGAHPLLVRCEVALAEPAEVELVLAAEGVRTRHFPSPASASHALVAWGLEPDTEWRWSVAGFEGTVRTGPLPPAFEAVDIKVSGDLGGVDAVLVPLECGAEGFALIDGDGDVLWYVADDVWGGPMGGYTWTPDQTLLVGSGGEVVERAPSGERVARWTGFTGRAHHDLARWGPYTYVLHDEEVQGLAVDGIHVFEGESLVGTFRFEDHFAIAPRPDAIGNDWAHANGLRVGEDGLVLVSLRGFDTVVAIDGDPASDAFLEVAWMAAGTAEGLPGADFVAPALAGEGFATQHNASLVDGQLVLFDNRGTDGRSRAARYRLDPSGAVLLDEAWSLGTGCTIQGGAEPTEDGVLATCATVRQVKRFVRGSPDPVFELVAGCQGQGSVVQPINRGMPVRLD